MGDLTITLGNELSLEDAPILLARLEPIWEMLPSLREVDLDLSDVTFIWPSALTLLATTILRLRQEGIAVRITRPRSDKVDTYLNRIDFYSLAGLDAEYPWVRHDASGRFREVVQVQTEQEGESVAQEVLEILRRNVEGVENIYAALQYAFLEVVNNVFHHAHSPTHAVLCAQSYPSLRRVELVVVDTGRGIPASLRDNPKLRGRFHTAAEAIHLAVQPRITGRPEHNTGEGLFFTIELIKSNGGDACIHSRDGLLRVRNGAVEVEEGPLWPGTWVGLRFRTDRPVNTQEIFNRHAPPEADYEWLFEEEIPF